MVQNPLNAPEDRLQPPKRRSVRRHGMTVVEIVAVVGIIILLMGILLPALGIASGNARWAKSQSNMRQIYQLMQEYTTDNREIICPAAFDYRQSGYPGKVRSAQPQGAVPPMNTPVGQRLNYGTWSDILWTYGDFSVPKLGGDGSGTEVVWNYRYDSPDRAYYETNESYDSIFRAALKPTLTPGGDEATPYGTGARPSEAAHNGYFAANLLFDARTDTNENLYGAWRNSSEVRRPSNTVYLVDSTHGETIEPSALGFGSPEDPDPGMQSEGQVDFRYPGETTLMLYMDGHVGTEGRWEQFSDLREIRNILVDSLR